MLLPDDRHKKPFVRRGHSAPLSGAAFPPAQPVPQKSAEELALLNLCAGLRNEISSLSAHDAAALAEHHEISARVVGPPPRPAESNFIPPSGMHASNAAASAAAAAAAAVLGHHSADVHGVHGVHSVVVPPPHPAGPSSFPPAAFTTLGLPPCSVRAATATDDAEHAESLARPFTPRINAVSENLSRSVPVHEMLLGKKQIAQQKLKQTAAVLEEERQRASERTQPVPPATDRLAQRYSERVGQSASERLTAPRVTPAMELARLENERVGSSLTPFAPDISCGAGPMRALARGGGGFQTIPNAASSSSSSAARLSRGGSGGGGGGPSGHGRPSPGGSCGRSPRGHCSSSTGGYSTAATTGTRVWERSAKWNQHREQKLQQQKNRRARAESEACTFKPKVENAVAASSLGVADRCQVWQQQKDRKLQALIHKELQQAAAENTLQTSSSRRSSSHGFAGDSASPAQYWAGGEPGFMRPTVASREGIASATLPLQTAWLDSNAAFAQHQHVDLPEWAAPRAQPLELLDLT